jgi:hypothetical protein
MLLFQAVTLDTDAPDREATLVFRGGRLLAVLTCLSEIHADLAGKWFLEAAFADVPDVKPQAFDTIDHFREWLAGGYEPPTDLGFGARR